MHTVREILKKVRDMYVQRKLKRLFKQRPLKVIIGSHVRAGEIVDREWISTSEKHLDLLKEETWQALCQPGTIDAILAEHVWEHLSREDGEKAAAMCYKFLRRGGRLRLAVPDGHHPDPDYHEWVRPGGTGAGADDHKMLYTIHSLSEILRKVGFAVDPLEYFDEGGEFHWKEWNPQDGHIHRSRDHDERNKGGQLKYTSIIADAIKPG